MCAAEGSGGLFLVTGNKRFWGPIGGFLGVCYKLLVILENFLWGSVFVAARGECFGGRFFVRWTTLLYMFGS